MPGHSESVFLAGDASQIIELGEQFRRAGFRVACRPNPAAGLPLPRGFTKVAAPPRGAAAAFELTGCDRERKRRNIRLMDGALPPSTVMFSGSVTVTAAEQATWMRRPSRLVGISALPTLLSRPLIELAPTRLTAAGAMKVAGELFGRIGKETAVVQDRIGMVMPRILAMVVNEAAFALTESVASAADIDTAMRLGTNYPLGPIAWADRIGVENIVAVLKSLNDDLGEERYRIAPLLSQLATGSRWWKS